MSVIVCNAGPLIALAGVGQIPILRHLFRTVLVASEVRAEVEAGERTRAGARLFDAAPWLQVAELARPADRLLSSLLDAGEAATIALALERTAALVLIDEPKARRVARDVYHLAVVGTGRLLVEAKRAFLIGQVGPLIEQMRENGYWMGDKIVEAILREAGE
ncbi:MAG TPA: DUF3368 domain-containing protein [Chthoniobacteraceae bacterium]|jgi:predicted nucleic acid-binding protein|nr:DUF3368 domain-containing protein [Chthoniobacteraceae bacterium]